MNTLAFKLRNPTNPVEIKTSTKVRFSSQDNCYKLFVRNTQTENNWCSIKDKLNVFPKEIVEEFKNIRPETFFCVEEPEYFFKTYRKFSKQTLQKTS